MPFCSRPASNYHLFDGNVHSLQYLKLQSQPKEPQLEFQLRVTPTVVTSAGNPQR